MPWVTKSGGFISIKPNCLRDSTLNLLNVCNDVEIELRLLPVTGKNLEIQMVNRCNEARVDV